MSEWCLNSKVGQSNASTCFIDFSNSLTHILQFFISSNSCDWLQLAAIHCVAENYGENIRKVRDVV